MGRKLTHDSLGAQPGGIQPVKSIFRNSVDISDSLSYVLMVCETRRTGPLVKEARVALMMAGPRSLSK